MTKPKVPLTFSKPSLDSSALGPSPEDRAKIKAVLGDQPFRDEDGKLTRDAHRAWNLLAQSRRLQAARYVDRETLVKENAHQARIQQEINDE